MIWLIRFSWMFYVLCYDIVLSDIKLQFKSLQFLIHIEVLWYELAGNLCQYNIDECLADPCQNGAVCIDKPGSYFCDCPRGYDGKFKKEINKHIFTCICVSVYNYFKK